MSTEKKTDAQPDIMSLEYWFAPEFLPIAEIQPEKIRRFEWRKDDIVVVTVPRSGTHLVWMITRMLVQGSAEPILDPMEESHVWLPAFKDTQTGTRVLNTHFTTRDVTESALKDGNRKFIYVTRNCKDVSVSQFNILKKIRIFSEIVVPHIWEEYLPKFYNFIPESLPMDDLPKLSEALGEDQPTEEGNAAESRATETKPSEKQPPVMLSRCNWVNNVRTWENYAASNPDVPILFLYFEDIVQHLDENIRKIAAFLSLPISDRLLEGIVTACEFDKMKKAPVSGQMSQLWIKGAEKTFFRKGAIGDWKNWYTVAQNEFADDFLAKDMKGSKIVPIYE